jgi:hypothetical protein
LCCPLVRALNAALARADGKGCHLLAECGHSGQMLWLGRCRRRTAGPGISNTHPWHAFQQSASCRPPRPCLSPARPAASTARPAPRQAPAPAAAGTPPPQAPTERPTWRAGARGVGAEPRVSCSQQAWHLHRSHSARYTAGRPPPGSGSGSHTAAACLRARTHWSMER